MLGTSQVGPRADECLCVRVCVCVCVCASQVRSQQVLLLQVRRSGHMVQVLRLGQWCREDDELVVQQAEAAEHR